MRYSLSAEVEAHHRAVGGLEGEDVVDGGEAGKKHCLHNDAAMSEDGYPLLAECCDIVEE